jgi:hypothetical protein
MIKNVSSADKVIRLLVAALMVVLVIAKVITGTWSVILIILAVVLVVTSLVSFCPIYTVLGINTNKKKE